MVGIQHIKHLALDNNHDVGINRANFGSPISILPASRAVTAVHYAVPSSFSPMPLVVCKEIRSRNNRSTRKG